MVQSTDKLQQGAFAFLGIATIAAVLAAFGTEMYYLALLPFALIIAWVAITNFKLLYFVLLFSIPPSIEYYFSSSLATDLPDEPLMIGLMLVTIVYLAYNYKALPKGFFMHGIMIALALHLFWIFISAMNSVNLLVSFKVFLAKMWYVTAFSILTAIVIRTKDDLKKAFWCIYIPLTLLIAQVIVRHAMQGFSFEDINDPMTPFFRNHVNYAAIVTIFLPFIWLARGWYAKGTFTRRLLTFSILFYIVAIYLSYTRTCYIAVAAIIPAAIVIKQRLMKPALVLVTIGIVAVGIYLFTGNKFIDYAPVYQETIIHDEFGDHLSSTFEGKDVSSMERVYRWVAATRMWKAHPVFGFGPGNFFPYYKQYTLSSFETYVSDNPERSTTHNYFLLLLSEQGVTGIAIFLLLTVVIFIYAEQIYHRVRNAEDKRIVLTLTLVIIMVYVNLLLSDMLESDKVGPFFYIGIALLVSIDIKDRLLLKAQG